VALPDMMGNLGASLDQIAWVSTGYILASVIVIPLTAWLGSFFGRKRYFVGSIVIFTLASFFCGSSTSLSMLIFWRIVQGVGGGALMTVSQAVLFESFPAEEAGLAMALFGLGIMVGPTVGPTLGGWLTDNYGWPWIFYVNLPVGVVAALMIAGYVHDPADQKRAPTVDFMGIGLLTVSVGALQFVVEHGQREDWFASRLILGLTIVGVVGGALLLWRELTAEHPVIDFRVLRHRQVWVGTLLGVVMGIGLFASVFTLPVFMQGNLHMTAEQTGILLFPGALSTAVSMFIVGRLSRVVDPRLAITTGALIFAVAMWQLSRITGLSGTDDFFWPLVLRGMGLGLMFVPLTTLTLADLRSSELAQGTGVYNFFRQLGGSFGIAAIASLVTRYTGQLRDVLAAELSFTDPDVLARVSALTKGFISKGADPFTAHQMALRMIDAQVRGQASVIAYGKVYVLSAILILALIPLLFLVKPPRRAVEGHVMVE
jgi:DHA2 family multidrug resistance protein